MFEFFDNICHIDIGGKYSVFTQRLSENLDFKRIFQQELFNNETDHDDVLAFWVIFDRVYQD